MSRIYKRKQSDSVMKGAGHPIMFGMPEAEWYDDFPEGGGYPIRFLKKAHEIMGADPEHVLHVCSGSVKTGVRVDIRAAKRPTVRADARWLPFLDDSFQWVMADPPYSADHAENLYQTGSAYPSPHTLAQECLRVLKPGGLLGFMHPMVPKISGGKFIKVYTLTQGPGYNVRAWSLIQKREVSNK